MKKGIVILAALLMITRTYGQTNYEPQILILSPGKVTYDKTLEKEIATNNELIKKNINEGKPTGSSDADEDQKQPPNIQAMMKSETEFSKNMDFAKQTSYLCEQFLAYRFFEKFPNLMIILKDKESSGKPGELKKLSEESQLQYVLSFPSLSFYRENNMNYAKLAVQLYDHSTNSILIDSSYIGDWYNPGFEFACSDSTLECTIHNAIAPALDNVINAIAENSPTLQKERELAFARLGILRDEYYSKPFNKAFVSDIISAKDSSVAIDNLYQLLISDDKTKFVAFFLSKKSIPGFKQLNADNQDNNIKILNDKDIRDTGYLNDIPQTYAYIVKAVKYNSKWYYEKAEVTYFEPEDGEEGRLQYFNNLQDWGFFKDDSTSLNPDFWETNLFEKVKDLRKDPEWDKYGETIWKTEEEENRNYIGLYEIVAKQLKTKKTNQPKKITIN